METEQAEPQPRNDTAPAPPSGSDATPTVGSGPVYSGAPGPPEVSASPPCPAPAPGASRPRRGRGCLIALILLILLSLLLFALATLALHRLAGVLNVTHQGLTGASPIEVHEELLLNAKSGSDRKIAIIDVKGIIVGEAPFDAASAKVINSHLNTARRDENVVALILDINSPGGEVTASDEIHHAVQTLRKTGRPVVACMHAVGASGAYLVACGTDYILANRLTLTGSIGVVTGTLNYARLFEKIGIRSEIYKSGEMKDFLHGGRERTQAEKDRMNELIGANFRAFAQIIADGRDSFSSVEEVLNAGFADGGVLSGQEAYELGLVDGLGYLDDAVRKARELAGAPDAKVIRYRRSLKIMDPIFSMQSAGLPGMGALAPELRLIKPGRMYYLMPAVMP